MNYIIDRRTFLKVIGASAITITTIPSLSACTSEPSKRETISINYLTNYQLAIYQKNNHKSAIYVGYKAYLEDDESIDTKYFALDITESTISEYSLYRRGADKNLDINASTEENFKRYFNILSLEPAINSVQSVIGIKEEYTAEDLRQTLDAVEQELNQKEKVLTK